MLLQDLGGSNPGGLATVPVTPTNHL